MPINTGGQQSGITGQPSKLAVEAGEVVDIILDESHPEYTDTGNGVGCCLVRLIQTQRNQSDYSLNWLKPASANNIQYPLIGELVMCMDGASADSQRQSGATMKYWLPYPQNVFTLCVLCTRQKTWYS